MTSNRIAGTPAFVNEMERLAEDYDALQARLQLGYMLVIVDEMADVCPNVATFHLDVHSHGDWLTTYDAQDAEGNLVSQEEQEGLEGLFLHGDKSDFSRYLYEKVTVQDLIDDWQ